MMAIWDVWLGVAQARARRAGEGFEPSLPAGDAMPMAANDVAVRELATTARGIRPCGDRFMGVGLRGAANRHCRASSCCRGLCQLLMTQYVLPNMDTAFLSLPRGARRVSHLSVASGPFRSLCS